MSHSRATGNTSHRMMHSRSRELKVKRHLAGQKDSDATETHHFSALYDPKMILRVMKAMVCPAILLHFPSEDAQDLRTPHLVTPVGPFPHLYPVPTRLSGTLEDPSFLAVSMSADTAESGESEDVGACDIKARKFSPEVGKSISGRSRVPEWLETNREMYLHFEIMGSGMHKVRSLFRGGQI